MDGPSCPTVADEVGVNDAIGMRYAARSRVGC